MGFRASGGMQHRVWILSNVEKIRFYVQYLRALPTLGLLLPGRGVAQWETTAWHEAIHGEPLCAKSAL